MFVRITSDPAPRPTYATLARITPSGKFTEFPDGAGAGASPTRGEFGITSGADGAVWFTEPSDPGRLGRITAAGQLTELTTVHDGGAPSSSTPHSTMSCWAYSLTRFEIERIETAAENRSVWPIAQLVM